MFGLYSRLDKIIKLLIEIRDLLKDTGPKDVVSLGVSVDKPQHQ